MSVNIFEYRDEETVVPQDVTHVRVHTSVTVLPDDVFEERKKLVQVDLPEGLLEIGYGAFYECKSLKSITIPSTVILIDAFAFANCNGLEEINLNCKELVTIGEHAFYYCVKVKRVSIPPLIRVIEKFTFYGCNSLDTVELCEGLEEIEESGFDKAPLKHLVLPSTVKRIGKSAFSCSKLLSVWLPDSIESIGKNAFCHAQVAKFKVPPLIQTISNGLVAYCESIFSVELPQCINLLKGEGGEERDFEPGPFAGSHFLRNVCIPSNAEMRSDVLSWGEYHTCTDLKKVFTSKEEAVNALKHRFDNLRIHSMLYYQSYQPVEVDQLNNALLKESNESDEFTLCDILYGQDSISQSQDCVGMTRLHILACSTIQNLELYRVLVEAYPKHLITEDKWGALPFLYVVWGSAPNDIIQYLVTKHQSFYPDYEFNWTLMFETLGLANAPQDVIQNLLNVHQESFPEQTIDWTKILDNLGEIKVISETSFLATVSTPAPEAVTFRFLVKCSISKRVKALGLKQWRDDMSISPETKAWKSGEKRELLASVQSKLAHYEAGYRKLKEATSMLELALWKAKIDAKGRRKKRDRDVDGLGDHRKHCRVNCGADIVIEHVLPYLL